MKNIISALSKLEDIAYQYFPATVFTVVAIMILITIGK